MPKYTLSDGRYFTDYSPNVQSENDIQKKYGVKSNGEYKRYLQLNAESIIKDMSKNCNSNSDTKVCPVCSKSETQSSWTPKGTSEDNFQTFESK